MQPSCDQPPEDLRLMPPRPVCCGRQPDMIGAQGCKIDATLAAKLLQARAFSRLDLRFLMQARSGSAGPRGRASGPEMFNAGPIGVCRPALSPVADLGR